MQSALRLLRAHLDLDVAFVSELAGGRRVLRYVEAEGDDQEVEAGRDDPAADGYCGHVVAGRLPPVIRDATRHPLTAAMPVTSALRIRTHISVPLVMSDGRVYGTFCGYSRTVLDSVDERDLATARMLAELVSGHVQRADRRRRALERQREELNVAALQDLRIVHQPIVDLADDGVIGYEALARFPGLDRGPAAVFSEAWALGGGATLEIAALRAAIDTLDRLPSGTSLSVNASPSTIESEEVRDILAEADGRRVVVEITEHAAVSDYARLSAAIARLSGLGVRLAIDDVGAGISGLNHIVRLSPEVLKIDGSLVGGVDRSAAKRAMIAALATYARRTCTVLVAERVETPAERDVLCDLGVGYGQGFLLGRPEARTAWAPSGG